jgi:RNA polymerase sigma factor FliA
LDSLPNTLTTSEEALFLQTMPLVKAIVASIWRGLPAFADFDDLMQAGSMGLLDAVRRFDASKGVPFALYAKFRIRGAVLDSLRQLDELGRADRRRVKQHEAERATAAQDGVAAGVVEDGLKDVSEYIPPILARIPIHAVSTWDHLDTEDRAIDPASKDDTPEQLYGSTVVRKLLAETVSGLPPRYQQIINLYYNGEMTMSDIGKLLGVNQSRVSQMHKSALSKMATTLADRGLASGDLMAVCTAA